MAVGRADIDGQNWRQEEVAARAGPGRYVTTGVCRRIGRAARARGPDGADPACFIRDVRVIDLAAIDRDLDARVLRVDIAARGRQLRDRARQHGLRTHAETWGDA